MPGIKAEITGALIRKSVWQGKELLQLRIVVSDEKLTENISQIFHPVQKILVLASLHCWEHVGKVDQLQPHVIGQVSANQRLLLGEPTNEIVVV